MPKEKLRACVPFGNCRRTTGFLPAPQEMQPPFSFAWRKCPASQNLHADAFLVTAWPGLAAVPFADSLPGSQKVHFVPVLK